MTLVDPLMLLTLERTFCVHCFRAGLRPPAHKEGILGGVRFGRKPALTARELSAYRAATRRRVIRHMVKFHLDIVPTLRNPDARGGARPGAGRKSKQSGAQDQTFRLYEQHIAAIQRWKAKYDCDSTSEAVRQMIEKANDTEH